MSERRRSLLILLARPGPASPARSWRSPASRRSSAWTSRAASSSSTRRSRPPQQPTVTQDVARPGAGHHAPARRRVRRRGARAGAARLQPDRGQPAGRLGRAAGREPGRLDGPAVLLRLGERTSSTRTARPTRPRSTAASTPIAGLYNAVKQAAKCPPQIDGNNNAADQDRGSTRSTRSRTSRSPTASRSTREAEALRPRCRPAQRCRRDDHQGADRHPRRPRREARARTATSPPPDRCWVIQDDPALSGTDIKNPKQNFDQQGNQPIVTFNFTSKGRQAFQDITRKIAQRGQDNSLPGSTRSTASSTSRSCSTTSWSRRRTSTTARTRTASTAATGAQISGGFTIQTAQDLAKILKIGALPIRLELISRSQVSAIARRSRRSHQGLIAGVAGFIIVALFLIIFYRVLGLIADGRAGHLRALLLRADQADPDHDDPAGHRGPDPHARRRGRREHRRLRTRQGGDTRGPRRGARRSSRATARA